MLILHADEAFLGHDTGRGHPECSERARVVTDALVKHAKVAKTVAATVGRESDVALVHDKDYVASLRSFIAEGGGELDADTRTSKGSWDAAIKASGAVVRAVEQSLEAKKGAHELRSFCAVRPPGHHARPARAMGFCLFNNAAVGAARAVEVLGAERVAILDFDVHHGNGTQEIFWRDPRVLYISLHRYPFYPGTGAAEETGEGKGKGTTLNLPLRATTGPAKYREAFSRAVEAISGFQPAVVIASAGFDAYSQDPVGGLGLSAEDYRWIGAELRKVSDAVCGGRLVSALEGGYAIEALPELVSAYVDGVEG